MSVVRRSRWAAIGAAVAVSLGAGGLGLVRASSGVESSFVSLTPARALDTRTGLGLVGPLVSPSPRVLQVTGSIARPDGTSAVVVPTGASAVVLNVTVVGPTAAGFVSVRPDGAPGAPETSNLNFTAGDIIPNAVTVALPSSGQIELTYDAFGAAGPTTDVLVDVTGYYTPTTPSDTIPSGQTVTGVWGQATNFDVGALPNFSIALPDRAPVALTQDTINFAPDSFAQTIDDDASCTGTGQNPTAPPGKVCLYLSYGEDAPEAFSSIGLEKIANLGGYYNGGLDDTGFYVSWQQTAPGFVQLYISWAYTAP